MAVFRVEKNHNYTVMSNYHLRDTRLTLKSIGLLSKMLSLTDEWDYTTRGLAAICKEGVDAIGAALKELELHGYLVRRQLRDSRGRITDTAGVSPTPSTLSTNPRIRPCRIRLHQIRKTRIWIPRIRRSHIRKSPRN